MTLNFESQKSPLSIFYSVGRNPLKNWSVHTRNGHCKRVIDEDIRSVVLEIKGTNITVMYITIPAAKNEDMNIRLPFLVLLIKNMNWYCSFEVKVKDDTNFYRRFRLANFQSKSSVTPFSTTFPLSLSPGWNQIQLNLSDFVRRAYGTNYIESVRLTVNASIRIRRIYFTDRLYDEDELPNEYRLVPRPKPRRSIMNYHIPAARPPSPAHSNRKAKVAGAPSTHGAASVVEPTRSVVEFDATIPINAQSSVTQLGSIRSAFSAQIPHSYENLQHEGEGKEGEGQV